ncbi:F-box/FBD/LRR-repeat protein At1g13570 isoform X1 [Helianthus annuus]|nr:F-box/FBD/LRR-repeat protein At1g13570 isoform X1 [Helianthus annuus]
MKAKRLSDVQQLDIITTLPQAIIETILCLLPIEEAARTSILSKEWRYKWTKIPNLVFDQFSTVKISNEEKELSLYDQTQPHFYKAARKNKDTRCTLFRAIHQVLLQRQGPILEFTLTMSTLQTPFEIDQVILHLSRNHTVKKLTLDFYDPYSYYLLLPVLPWRHLTDLNIISCVVNHKPIFNGFGSLTSLSLNYVTISRGTLMHLLYNCPSLKSLCLSMQRIYADHLPGDENPSIMELFKCLPVVEDLTTWGDFTLLLVQASVPEELPTSLIHLKYCTIDKMCFFDGYGLPFLLVLIKCSPNLTKIKLEINTDCCTEIKPTVKLEEHSVNLEEYSVELEEYSVMLEKCSVMFEEYSYVWLEHLNELEIEDFSNFEPELEFVKFILARSPNLKKVILLTRKVDKNEESEMLKILLRVPRASPVEIIVVSY